MAGSSNIISPEQIGISGDGLRFRSANTPCDEDAGEDISRFRQQLPLSQNERKWAIFLSLTCAFDILLGSSSMMIIAFKYAYRDGGVSLISMGFQMLSHWISSGLLLLRLVTEIRSKEGNVDQGLLLKRRRTQLYREQGLSVSMGLFLLVSSCAILFKAFRKLRFWGKWYEDLDRHRMDKETEMISEWLAWTGFGLYVLHAGIRCIGASKVRIQLLSHTSVVSVISLVYLFVIGLAAVNEKEWSWKAEPIAAIVLVFVTLVEGIRIVFYYLDDMDARLRQCDRA